jgi:putative spermidine/putrescine transport system permease protein
MMQARRAGDKIRFWTAALIAPAALFLLVNFAIPIITMLARGVADPELPEAWPHAAVALRQWDGAGLPDDRLVGVIAADMLASQASGTLSRIVERINFASVGSRSLVVDTVKALRAERGPMTLARLRGIDSRWGRREIWATLRHAAGPITSFYLLAASDLRADADGHVTAVPPEQRVFVDVMWRTFKISAVVTLLCVVLGYPTAFLLATLRTRTANPLMLLVILPFWTSTLVRTTAWTVLLQIHGIVNEVLQSLRLIGAPLELLYNRTGVYIAMTHVLLPFMILPLYGVMKGISPEAMRAARSLGAGAFTAFRKVYLPQSLPGVIAGAVIVFTLALGFYITPALVGGGADQMISAFITFYVNQSLNWGMAAALSILLLLALLVVLGIARLIIRPSEVLSL